MAIFFRQNVITSTLCRSSLQPQRKASKETQGKAIQDIRLKASLRFTDGDAKDSK